MESEKIFQPKPEKPAILYHASQAADIERLEPRSVSRREQGGFPAVFASPNKAIATTFLFPWDDTWVQSGAFDDEPHIVISDEERFRQVDTGGYVYSLPGDTFVTDTEKGLGTLEYASDETVETIDSEYFPSALDAMIDAGVKVYFVDKETFAKICDAPDYGREILASQVPVGR